MRRLQIQADETGYAQELNNEMLINLSGMLEVYVMCAELHKKVVNVREAANVLIPFYSIMIDTTVKGRFTQGIAIRSLDDKQSFVGSVHAISILVNPETQAIGVLLKIASQKIRAALQADLIQSTRCKNVQDCNCGCSLYVNVVYMAMEGIHGGFDAYNAIPFKDWRANEGSTTEGILKC